MCTDSSVLLSNGVRKGFLNIVDTSAHDLQFCVPSEVVWRTGINARRERVEAIDARSRDEPASEISSTSCSSVILFLIVIRH